MSTDIHTVFLENEVGVFRHETEGKRLTDKHTGDSS